MIYHPKKTGPPVDAIQLTGPDSAKRIRREFACSVDYRPDEAMAIVDGTRVERGEYVIAYMCALIVRDPDWFDGRYRKFERQEELFKITERTK
jgi:hypothetical protein